MYIEAKRIVELIIEKGQDLPFKSRMINSLLGIFERSASFDNAGERIDLLRKVKEFDNIQIKRLFNAVIDNGQIYHSSSASAGIKELYNKYKDKIDKDTLEGLKIVKPTLFK